MELKVIDITLPKTGIRVALSSKEIDKIGDGVERAKVRGELKNIRIFGEAFNPEMQEVIFAELGEKLKSAMLEVQKRHFDFSSADTFHLHILIESENLNQEVYKKNGVDFDKLDILQRSDLRKEICADKSKYTAVLKQVKSLIVHCAEWPTKSQMSSSEYWIQRESRNVVVNEGGVEEIYASKEVDNEASLSFAKSKGLSGTSNFPSQGVVAGDYNKLNKTNYADLAASGVGGIRFILDEEKGIQLDPSLPKLAFAWD